MFRPGAGEARTSKKGSFVMSEISGEQPALLEGWLLRESTYVSHVVNRCALHCTIPCSSMAACLQQSCPGNPRIRSAYQPHRRIRAPSAWNLIHRIWIQLRLSWRCWQCASLSHACRRYAILRQSELVTLRRKNDLSTAKSWRLSSSSRVDPPGKKTFNRVKAGAEKSLWAAISNQATETYLVRRFLTDCMSDDWYGSVARSTASVLIRQETCFVKARSWKLGARTAHMFRAVQL